MRKKRILIIDDEENCISVLKDYLERRGDYEVRGETRGAHGLRAAQEFRPDLILLDIVMPDKVGGAVAAEICADGELGNTPIIFLTAAVLPEEAQAQRGIIGGNAFIAKPVKLTELIQKIETSLEE